MSVASVCRCHLGLLLYGPIDLFSLLKIAAVSFLLFLFQLFSPFSLSLSLSLSLAFCFRALRPAALVVLAVLAAVSSTPLPALPFALTLGGADFAAHCGTSCAYARSSKPIDAHRTLVTETIADPSSGLAVNVTTTEYTGLPGGATAREWLLELSNTRRTPTPAVCGLTPLLTAVPVAAGDSVHVHRFQGSYANNNDYADVIHVMPVGRSIIRRTKQSS